jgi:hypothetical protein
MTEKQQSPGTPDEDRLEVEDLAPKDDESADLKGGSTCENPSGGKRPPRR